MKMIRLEDKELLQAAFEYAVKKYNLPVSCTATGSLIATRAGWLGRKGSFCADLEFADNALPLAGIGTTTSVPSL